MSTFKHFSWCSTAKNKIFNIWRFVIYPTISNCKGKKLQNLPKKYYPNFENVQFLNFKMIKNYSCHNFISSLNNKDINIINKYKESKYQNYHKSKWSNIIDFKFGSPCSPPSNSCRGLVAFGLQLIPFGSLFFYYSHLICNHYQPMWEKLVVAD